MKKVTLYTDPKDPFCAEIEKFLRGFEISLQVHDLRSKPLTPRKLGNLLGHFDLEHFVDSNGNSGKAKKLDISFGDRDKILELMAKDIGLLRKPIIVSGRLMALGYDKHNILKMLQLEIDESQSEVQTDSAA
jgi:arsenate reductase-like glutaredoxin family protein